jgi:hypothetical protein
MIHHEDYIDEGTGELRFRRAEHITEAMTEDGYRFPSHKSGARLFRDVQFPAEMTDSDLGKMTRLSKHMVGATNMLGYRQRNDIIPYSTQEIGDLVGLSGSHAREFVARMCGQRIMQRIVVNSGPQYYINPAYFMASGKRLSLDLFLLFRDELAPILPGWVINDFLRQARPRPTSAVVAQAERIINTGTVQPPE